jgi:hypothetical protein
MQRHPRSPQPWGEYFVGILQRHLGKVALALVAMILLLAFRSYLAGLVGLAIAIYIILGTVTGRWYRRR